MPFQIGSNVLTALQHPGTVAVLTVVEPGMGVDRVASIPLDAGQFQVVQQALGTYVISDDDDESRRIGFGREE